MTQIEKRPGFDWTITYEDDDEVFEMAVFGAMSIDEAISDARSSFRPNDVPTILAAVRDKP